MKEDVKKLELVIGDSELIERRLRRLELGQQRIEEGLDKLFTILDNFDDFADILVAQNEMINQLKTIGTEEN
jgi:hypothetical protein